MIRWLIKQSDYQFSMNRVLHPHIRHMLQLEKRGLDQSFWMGICHESFISFLNHSNTSLENVGLLTARSATRNMVKTQLPVELKNQIRRILSEEKLLESKFELSLLVHLSDDITFQLPWEHLCSISTKGLEGVFQSIKACWLVLFRPGVLTTIQNMGLDLTKIQVSVHVKLSQAEILRGKAFSFSPRCPWDRRHSVISYEKNNENYSFLVDRSSFRCTYYGKNNEWNQDLEKMTQNTSAVLASNKTNEQQLNFQYDKVRKIAEFLQRTEKNLESFIQFEWAISSDQRVHINRIQTFDRAPSSQQMSPHFNTTARNVWDQSLIQWDSNSLIKPLWFSLVPRNFRTLAIHYIKALGIKNSVSPDYEKVFRGFWGILRGRLYINMAALHRFLGLSESHDLAEEIELNVTMWMKRYDRESREAWDTQWPQWPKLSRSQIKSLTKNKDRILKDWPEKISIWINDMHSLRESLVSTQWKEKNTSAMINALQDWERCFIPKLVPILMAEIQYRDLLSWYCEGSIKPLLNHSSDPSWTQTFELERREILPNSSMGWFSRRLTSKLNSQIEMLEQMRPKYISMLEDIYIKLRKFFEIIGQKFCSMGILEKSEDIFYLTFEEIMAFEEGRSSTVSWKKLVQIRQEEYRRYANDVHVPETWFTTGLVGLATQFPSIIAIKEHRSSERIVKVSPALNKGVDSEILPEPELSYRENSSPGSMSESLEILNNVEFIEDEIPQILNKEGRSL